MDGFPEQEIDGFPENKLVRHEIVQPICSGLSILYEVADDIDGSGILDLIVFDTTSIKEQLVLGLLEYFLCKDITT